MNPIIKIHGCLRFWFNLETAVECARACRCGRGRQGERTPQADACKDEQRCMARSQRCDRVHSALTQKVNDSGAKKLKHHKTLMKKTSGQLPFLGSRVSRRFRLKPSGGERQKLSFLI
ncbi:hypothetical protein [Ottowia testudinis]|uniref:Uncharacterized protein n=1 Tax=Ottowia testudinis TaxID=2816950 RepID=A0A975CDX5_9BURK|nr:hypothetical protein [Ottowia testudinis]QTD44067.1 hypothetical protein J1M35_13085 [Ottowia testudinis]